MGECLGSADVIADDPDVSLELAERSSGFRSEDPVRSPGIETEGSEAELKFGDVIASRHGLGHTQQA
jgi:hypothetical protein